MKSLLIAALVALSFPVFGQFPQQLTAIQNMALQPLENRNPNNMVSPFTRILLAPNNTTAFFFNGSNALQTQDVLTGASLAFPTISNSGSFTISGTIPSVITASGQANTGFLEVLGKTSGGLKLTTADATAFIGTVTLAAQTSGAVTLTIPNFASVNDTFVFATLAQTLANKTLTSPNLTLGGLSNHLYNNFATAGQTPAAATRTYITGSGLTITAGQIQVGTHIHWRFDMTKTAAGSASSTFDIAFGTAGTTSDTAQVSFTKPAGTAAGDEGWVDIDCVVKTNSASGVVVGEFTLIHNLAATGHAQIPCVVVSTTSSTFDTTTPTKIGICITSGASDAITINQVFVSTNNL